MGHRNRSRFFKGLDVQSQDIQLLKQDCEVLGISWSALQRTGSDLSSVAQGSTQRSNARSSNNVGDHANNGGAPRNPSLNSSQAAARCPLTIP